MRRARISTTAVFLALVVAPAAQGSIGNGDHFTVAVSPATVAGGAPVAFTITVGNEPNSPDRIGAANLTAPTGFQLTSASLPSGSPGTATVSNGVVQLRNLNVTRGSSVNVTVGAVSACGPGIYNWGAAATNEPNFSGRQFALDPGGTSLGTSISAGCSLFFSTDPADTAVGQVIGGTPFTPPPPPIQVEILDGNGQLSTSSSGPVTVALATNPGGGTLSGTTTVNAVNGVASFSNLSINRTGTGYTLKATSPGATPATSTPFNETSGGANCQPGQPSCQTTATTPTSTFTLTAPAGTSNILSVTVDPGTPLVCPGYTAQDPNWFSFTTSSTSVGKIVNYTVIPSGIGDTFAFCLGAPYEFTTSAGTPAPPATLPDGSSGFIGLLPRCNQGFGGPCVDSLTKTPDPSSPLGYDVTQKVEFPAGLPGDPIGRV